MTTKNGSHDWLPFFCLLAETNFVDAWRLFALLGSEGERDALFLQGGGQIDNSKTLTVQTDGVEWLTIDADDDTFKGSKALQTQHVGTLCL